jgi:glutamyl-tRNA synthetase/glutamyl-Q tRNA(Asp) synthetase
MPQPTPPFVPSGIPPDATTRFAPAPTGFLHLGHIVNAIFVWGVARRHHGRVLLRVEDHDRGRSRSVYELALLEDLEWLGLEPDEPTLVSFHTGSSPFRQSDRGDRYVSALNDLALHNPVYGCRCTRRDIAAGAEATPGEERRYPGTCRELGHDIDEDGVGVRVVVGPGSEAFVDLLLGPQRQTPERQCGDILVRDRTGQWTYQFAVTVDDYDQGVDLVIRGEDLLSSTGRQIRLARMLGREEPPRFLHHPLVLKRSGEKLSKASGDTGIRELRAAGVGSTELLGEAAYRGGLLSTARPLTADDLADLFG